MKKIKVTSPNSLTKCEIPKLDFPRFDGTNVKGWIQKCNEFFLLNPVPEHKKVLYISMHMDGKAESWLQATFKSIEGVTWGKFREALLAKFSENYETVIAELNQLQQLGTVMDYQAKFDELKLLALKRRPELTEPYFVDCFMRGLKWEIKDSVQRYYPQTLDQAISLSKLKESSLDSLTSRSTFVPRPYPFATSPINLVKFTTQEFLSTIPQYSRLTIFKQFTQFQFHQS